MLAGSPSAWPLGVHILAVGWLRMALAVLVFGLSQWPALAGMTDGPGLWKALPDALSYHQAAIGVRQANDFFVWLIGPLYQLSPSPLIVILWWPIVDMLTLWSLAWLATTIWCRPPPAWWIYAVGFWPSWALWSTQLLRDSLILCASTVAVALAVSIVRRASRDETWRYGGFEWAAYSITLALLAGLRWASTDVLLLAAFGLLVPLMIGTLTRHLSWLAVAAGVALVMVTSLFAPHVREQLQWSSVMAVRAAHTPVISSAPVGVPVAPAPITASQVAQTVLGAGSPLPPHTQRTPSTPSLVRYLSVAEVPWLYGTVGMALIGLWRLRYWAGEPYVLLPALVALVGFVALALSVPILGLVFRYRLPYLLLLTVYVPWHCPRLSYERLLRPC